MSSGASAMRLADADRLLAQALHVERDLLLPLRGQHARVEDAGLQHRAQPGAQQLGVRLRIPRARPRAPRRRARGPARRRCRRSPKAACRRPAAARSRRERRAGTRNRSCVPAAPSARARAIAAGGIRSSVFLQALRAFRLPRRAGATTQPPRSRCSRCVRVTAAHRRTRSPSAFSQAPCRRSRCGAAAIHAGNP